MKFKLSYSEFTALYNVVKEMAEALTPAGLMQQVLYAALLRLYKKLHRKAFDKKDKYTITAEPDEACAFFMITKIYPLNNHTDHTVNLITQVRNAIHQKYNL